MKERDFTCIGCPLGCSLSVTTLANGQLEVSGYSCKIGEKYAIKEYTEPTRILTTTLKVINGKCPLVSVKTQTDIPKDKLFDCLKVLSNYTVTAPIAIGDILYENIENTGVNIVATRCVRYHSILK